MDMFFATGIKAWIYLLIVLILVIVFLVILFNLFLFLLPVIIVIIHPYTYLIGITTVYIPDYDHGLYSTRY